MTKSKKVLAIGLLLGMSGFIMAPTAVEYGPQRDVRRDVDAASRQPQIERGPAADQRVMPLPDVTKDFGSINAQPSVETPRTPGPGAAMRNTKHK